MELIETIAAGNTLGEGVLWEAETQSLWWSDIQEQLLYRLDWNSREIRSFSTPERLCSFGFIENDRRLIAAFESGFAVFDPFDGNVAWLARPERDAADVRFNDGRVDRQGRFWAGTMEERDDRTGRANLYCLDGAGRTHRRESGIAISNGICWSPDSRFFYFADSPKRMIFVYDFDSATGDISNRRVFAQTPEGASPDGANVDAEGFLWSAHWGASRVVRYAPDGKTDAILDVPASQPTCIAFGGPDLDLLFVTSAREGISPGRLAGEPSAGDVFVYKMGVKGLPDQRFVFDKGGD
jgi:L-arabinonolactonase